MTKANTRLLKNGRYVNRPLCEPWRTVHIQTKTKKYDFPWLLLHFLEAAGRLLCTSKDYIKLSMPKIQNKPKMPHKMSIMSNNPNFKNPSRYLGWSVKSLWSTFRGVMSNPILPVNFSIFQHWKSVAVKFFRSGTVWSQSTPKSPQCSQRIKESRKKQVCKPQTVCPLFFVGENRWRVDVVIRALRFRSHVCRDEKSAGQGKLVQRMKRRIKKHMKRHTETQKHTEPWPVRSEPPQNQRHMRKDMKRRKETWTRPNPASAYFLFCKREPLQLQEQTCLAKRIESNALLSCFASLGATDYNTAAILGPPRCNASFSIIERETSNGGTKLCLSLKCQNLSSLRLNRRMQAIK